MVDGLDIGGLYEVRAKSRLAGSLTIVLLTIASQCDQMHSLGSGIGAQAARNLIAIHLRQADVTRDSRNAIASITQPDGICPEKI